MCGFSTAACGWPAGCAGTRRFSLRGYRAERQPARGLYGTAAESEITFLWAMAQAGVDVLCFCPERMRARAFAGHYLPPLWLECCFEGSCPPSPSPSRRSACGRDDGL